jgi:hypothetical protein
VKKKKEEEAAMGGGHKNRETDYHRFYKDICSNEGIGSAENSKGKGELSDLSTVGDEEEEAMV